MDAAFDQQIGVYEHRLDHLLHDGLALHRRLTTDPDRACDLEVVRAWQRECAATISQLSGGNKAHWLSRAYSDAFLVRLPGTPEAVEEAGVDTLVERIMGVLRDAQASLAGMRQPGSTDRGPAPTSMRFTFVHDLDLRPRLEYAFADAQTALDRGDYGLAVVTWASILEAMITDALEHLMAGEGRAGEVSRSVADWTFDARIQAAEKARLISGGCARLPGIARQYRAQLDQAGELRADVVASARDAKVTGQVLRLIMRDLAPGR